jgi:putative Mn2+ efflux pump MntP
MFQNRIKGEEHAMEVISLLFIGVGLSMDAFSLSLCYGVLNLPKSKRILLASIVGIFHFFMPLLGMIFGNILEHFIIIDMKIVVFAIFMLLGVEMVNGTFKKEEDTILLNIIGLFLFAFTVSIDSFSAGIGIKFISNNYLLCSAIFCLTSFSFTYFGLIIGGLIGSKFRESSRFIGGFILTFFALYYLFLA